MFIKFLVYYAKDFEGKEKGQAKILAGRSQTLQGGIAKGKGRNGSQALLLDTSFYLVRSFEDKHYAPGKDYAYKNWRSQIGKRHLFPKPMNKGHFKCYIKQGPKTSKRRGKSPSFRSDPKPDEWFVMEILGKDRKLLDAVINEGGPDKPLLKLEKNTAGKVSITMAKWREDQFGAQYPDEDTWHEVKVVAENGKLDVSVDGQSIGTIPTASFSGITLHTRCIASMYVDDAELSYGE